jgi:hypothetical protein
MTSKERHFVRGARGRGQRGSDDALSHPSARTLSTSGDLRDYSERFERGELEVDGLLGSLVVSGAA